MQDAMSCALPVGSRVMLHSLKAAHEMNGRQGVLISWDASTLRWLVRLDKLPEHHVGPAEETDKTVAIKLENIGSMNATLERGSQVVLHSLQTMGMNGRKGSCLSWDGNAG
eukprot:1275350-Prymnesium_polylepis.1